jgi:hypothetical protein
MPFQPRMNVLDSSSGSVASGRSHVRPICASDFRWSKISCATGLLDAGVLVTRFSVSSALRKIGDLSQRRMASSQLPEAFWTA